MCLPNDDGYLENNYPLCNSLSFMHVSSHLLSRRMLGTKDIVAANAKFQTVISTELWQNL